MRKLFSTFNFPTLLTKVPHFGLISVLNKIIDFAFKGGNEKHNTFPGNSSTRCHKSKHLYFLSKKFL